VNRLPNTYRLRILLVSICTWEFATRCHASGATTSSIRQRALPPILQQCQPTLCSHCKYEICDAMPPASRSDDSATEIQAKLNREVHPVDQISRHESFLPIPTAPCHLRKREGLNSAASSGLRPAESALLTPLRRRVSAGVPPLSEPVEASPSARWSAGARAAERRAALSEPCEHCAVACQA